MRFKNVWVFCAFFLIVSLPVAAAALEVTNVRAQQRAGTKLVDITYDLKTDDANPVAIRVEISADGGATFSVKAQTFTGDVGAGVTAGEGKRAVWDAGVDAPNVSGARYMAKVTATVGESTASAIAVDLPGGAKMDFVKIEPGKFMMGSPASEADRSSNEGPQHEVTISKGFYLGKYEVTQGQWQAVMGTTPWAGQGNVQANAEHPAVYVSWEDAQAFVKKLNDAAGKALYALPTEAEWEYACRAGTTARWSFGDDESQLKDYAWYDVNAWDVGERYAHKVGTKQANPWGLYDMHGNVWEWCADRYGAYSSGAQEDPAGPASGSYRVFRGGDFNDNARLTRSAGRYNNSPGDRGYFVGFRLLRRAN